MHKILRTFKREHKSSAELLNIFEHQIDLIAAAEHPDIDIVDGVIEYFASFLLHVHHPKEEIVLAALKARVADEIAELSAINNEHFAFHQRIHNFAETVRGVLGERSLVMERQAFVDLAHEFIDLERAHMALEEKVFFPLARECLTAEDWQAIEASIAADPAFKPAVNRRHAQLRREIRVWQKENDG